MKQPQCTTAADCYRAFANAIDIVGFKAFLDKQKEQDATSVQHRGF